MKATSVHPSIIADPGSPGIHTCKSYSSIELDCFSRLKRYRKAITCLPLAMACMATILAPTQAWAARYVSMPGGDDFVYHDIGPGLPRVPGPNLCQDLDQPCATINWAVLVATPGETIALLGGPFPACSISIDKNLRIIGKQSSRQVIEGGTACRHFIVGQNSPATVTLKNLELINGDELHGGSVAVGAQGNVTFDNVSLRDNHAANEGGAIDNQGTVTIENGSELLNNRAVVGGAIKNVGTLTVSDSEISTNIATSVGGGIAGVGGTVSLFSTSMNENFASEWGGAIDTSNTSISVKDSSLSSNEVTSGHGGGISNREGSTLTIDDSVLIGNESGSGHGGALLNDGSSSTVAVTESVFTGNSAMHQGGGVRNSGGGQLTVTNASFDENSASTGGAIADIAGNSIDTLIQGSTFLGNEATYGGAVYYEGSGSGLLGVQNSTFSENSGGTNGAAIYDSGAGSARVANTTFYGQITSVGGAAIFAGSTVPLEINNSIISNTVDTNGVISNDCMATLGMTGGNNLSERCDAGNIDVSIGIVSDLDTALSDNGGPTFTHRLLEVSNAIDAGLNDCISAITNDRLFQDQRMFGRPLDGDLDGAPVCDIGAYEFFLKE